MFDSYKKIQELPHPVRMKVVPMHHQQMKKNSRSVLKMERNLIKKRIRKNPMNQKENRKN